MRVLILGGTGGIGQLLIQEALASAHTVVVYARSPQKLPEDIRTHKDVVVVEGGLDDADALDRALEGVHAVLSALGPSVKSGPMHPSGTPLAKAYALVISLMHKHGIKRIIALGTASNKDIHDKFNVQFWVLVHGVATFAHSAYEDVVAIGNTIRADDELMWTVVRVPILTDSKKKDYVAGYVGDGKTKPWLSRSAFAFFVMKELESNSWARKAPLLSVP